MQTDRLLQSGAVSELDLNSNSFARIWIREIGIHWIRIESECYGLAECSCFATDKKKHTLGFVTDFKPLLPHPWLCHGAWLGSATNTTSWALAPCLAKLHCSPRRVSVVVLSVYAAPAAPPPCLACFMVLVSCHLWHHHPRVASLATKFGPTSAGSGNLPQWQ